MNCQKKVNAVERFARHLNEGVLGKKSKSFLFAVHK